MRVFEISDQKGVFRAWDVVRKYALTGETIRLTIETVSDPISQVRRAALWGMLDRLASAVVLPYGLTLTARQWHQTACRLALGIDQYQIAGVPHEAAREPKHLTGDEFTQVANVALDLCGYFDVDLTDLDNDKPTNRLDASP